MCRILASPENWSSVLESIELEPVRVHLLAGVAWLGLRLVVYAGAPNPLKSSKIVYMAPEYIGCNRY